MSSQVSKEAQLRAAGERMVTANETLKNELAETHKKIAALQVRLAGYQANADVVNKRIDDVAKAAVAAQYFATHAEAVATLSDPVASLDFVKAACADRIKIAGVAEAAEKKASAAALIDAGTPVDATKRGGWSDGGAGAAVSARAAFDREFGG